MSNAVQAGSQQLGQADGTTGVALEPQRHAPGNILITQMIEVTASTAITSGGLDGFSVVVKDMIDVAGTVTTRGAAIFDPFPVERSAVSVTALEEAGASIVGKANQDEFAWGVTGDNPHWGRIANPTHPQLSAGGSSGGTAAAIAGGLARAGLGTDTAGSVRIPAACCGIVALRPRVGQVSSVGVFPLAPSFDTVGPMARTVDDCERMWRALGGGEMLSFSHSELRIGVFDDTPTPEGVERFGTELVRLPSPKAILVPFWTVMRAEAFRTHQSTFLATPELYGQGLQDKLSQAAKVSGEDERAARLELARMREAFREDTRYLDGIITSTLGRPAPEAGVDEGAVREDLGWLAAVFSALDMAAVAIGNVQIVAATEAGALGIGKLWEQTMGEVRPPW